MYSTPLLRWLLSFVAAISTFTTSTLGQSFEIFEPVGTNAQGYAITTAVNVSADGSAVIGSTSVSGSALFLPFIWRSDTGLFVITNSTALLAYDVANGGNRAALSDLDPQTGDRRALLWSRTNGLQSLGKLLNAQDSHVEPMAISANGKVIVGRAKTPNAPGFFTWEAFKWSAETGMVGLGDIVGDPQRDRYYSQAVGVSADGRVIAGTVRYGGTEPDGAFGYYAPARWANGVGPLYLAPSPHGDLDYGALGISANGRFIVAASSIGTFEDTVYYALRWSDENGYTILHEGSKLFTPHEISDDGKVVVGDGGGESGVPVAMIWTAERGLMRLQTLLIELGANPGLFTLEYAAAVSADGRVIVGYGKDVDGNRRGYRAMLRDLPPRKIVVNSVADRPALSAANCCDTGEKLANGEAECTLRAAIEAVNAGCGDRIEFAVPNVSIPKISPLTPLPALDVKVDIDGTTQSGGKVEISGTHRLGFVWICRAGAVPSEGW